MGLLYWGFKKVKAIVGDSHTTVYVDTNLNPDSTNLVTNKAIATVINTMNRTVVENDSAIDELNETVIEHITAIQELQQTLATATNNISALQTAVTNLNESLATANQKIATLENKVATLESKHTLTEGVGGTDLDDLFG